MSTTIRRIYINLFSFFLLTLPVEKNDQCKPKGPMDFLKTFRFQLGKLKRIHIYERSALFIDTDIEKLIWYW